MPASLKEPTTFFTFDLLDMFEEMTHYGKVSAYDFYQGIVAL
jgi:hypothetical protein